MATSGPCITHLPAQLSWYQVAIEEARRNERYCSACVPGHAPSLRLPDIQPNVSDAVLMHNGYTKLPTAPFSVYLLIAQEAEAVPISVGPIVGAKAHIWAPKKGTPRQHWIFNLRKGPEHISAANRHCLKEKIDEYSSTPLDTTSFPRAIVHG